MPFINRDDSASYIYKVLDYAWMNSNLIGSSFTKEQIISYLPDYNSKCVIYIYSCALWKPG